MLVIFGKGQIYLADQAHNLHAASCCLTQADFLGYLSSWLVVAGWDRDGKNLGTAAARLGPAQGH